MKPLRETHRYPPSFPFVFMYRELRTSRMDVPDHFHDWAEIVYVHEGESQFFINKSFFSMKPQDAFLLPGGTIHRVASTGDAPYTVSVILFSPSLLLPNSLGEPTSVQDLFGLIDRHERYRHSLDDDRSEAWEKRLDLMQLELQEGRNGHRLSVVLLLHQFLLDILRDRDRADPPELAKKSKSAIWMKEILSYIEDNLDQDLALPKLAEHAFISPTHFSRVFKQMTGFHVPEYLSVKRMLKAKHYLMHTEYPISYIATLCGYKSTPHFHQVFKAHTGTTPSRYRQGLFP